MSRYVSFVIRSWQDDRDGTMRWEAHRVQDEEAIHLPDAAFVVRAWVNEDEQMVRGLIRHVQSGRELQFQSGERVTDFVHACLSLDSSSSDECDLQSLGNDRFTLPELSRSERLSDDQTL